LRECDLSDAMVGTSETDMEDPMDQSGWVMSSALVMRRT